MRVILITGLIALTAAPAVAAGGANPFVGTIYQAIAAAVVFIAVMVILKKAAWGKILEGLQAREEKIKSDLEHAERSAEQAARTLEAYRKQLANAQEEAKRVIDQGRADAQKISAQLKSQAQTDINQLRARAEQEITQAKQQAVSELYAQAADLATAAAGRVLGRELSGDDHRRLAEESVAQIGGRLS